MSYPDSDMESLSSEGGVTLGKYLYDGRSCSKKRDSNGVTIITRENANPIDNTEPICNPEALELLNQTSSIISEGCGRLCKYAYPLLGSFSLTLLSEMILKSYGYAQRPSLYLNKMADWLVDSFWAMGSYVARFSSYLTHIDWQVLNDVASPMFRCVTSPIYTLKGYGETALTYMGDSWKIYLGSFIVLCLLIKCVRHEMTHRTIRNRIWGPHN